MFTYSYYYIFSGYGKFNYMLNLVAISAVWSTVFETSTVSYILPSAECDLGLSNLDKGILNAMVYGGKEIFMRCNKNLNIPCLIMSSVVTVFSKILLKSNFYVTTTHTKKVVDFQRGTYYKSQNFINILVINCAS
jgi:hypothetical protein